MAALPADDPMVLTSQKNLEDFCQAHGVPIKVLRLALDTTGGLDAFESEHAIGEPEKRDASPPAAPAFVEMPAPAIDAAIDAGVLFYRMGTTSIRLVTSWQTTADDVAEAGARFREALLLAE